MFSASGFSNRIKEDIRFFNRVTQSLIFPINTFN